MTGREQIRRDERWHGTRGGYTNHGCRCEACTAAHTKYHQRYMSDPEHARKHNERRRNKRGNP